MEGVQVPNAEDASGVCCEEGIEVWEALNCCNVSRVAQRPRTQGNIPTRTDFKELKLAVVENRNEQVGLGVEEQMHEGIGPLEQMLSDDFPRFCLPVSPLKLPEDNMETRELKGNNRDNTK